MVKPEEDINDIDDDIDFDEDESKDNDNTPIRSQRIGSEPDKDKQSVVEELFACEKRVYKLINSWSGNNKEDAIAGRKFLNNQYSALVGIINTTNGFTKKRGEECQKILHRANKAFIVDMLNEPTIKEKYYHSLFFTFWHTIELFLGLPRNGHGANVLRDALAGLNTPEPEEKKMGVIEQMRGGKYA